MSPKNQTLKTDIVILGGGGAGMAAATQAAENGAKVIVLEKRHAIGGNSAMAAGIFAADSPAQKRRMIDAPKDELFRLGMDFHHWTINPRILRAYVDISGDTIRWLEEKGVNFEYIPVMNPKFMIRTFHRILGATVLKPLVKECEERGVKTFCDTSAKKILTDAKGNVTGVLAETKDGELKIDAKSVIVSTGGYGANKKLLKKYYPAYNENTIYIGLKELTGDGLLMGIEVGAATENLGVLHTWGSRFPGTRLINLLNRRPDTVWVNKFGERYCDEAVCFDMGLRGNVVEKQPDKISYTIVDDQMIKNMVKENLTGAEGTIAGIMSSKKQKVEAGGARWSDIEEKELKTAANVVYGFNEAGTQWDDLPRQLEAEAAKGKAKISNSWSEIARWMGAAPATLKATMDEYNAFCDQGHDAIFVKDRRFLVPLRTPPYYALRCYSHFPDTIGGIKINHRMEVLDNQDKPISGLYAAGVCTGGWQSETYCFVLTGSMFGFALNSGRIAGENAAKFSRK